MDRAAVQRAARGPVFVLLTAFLCLTPSSDLMGSERCGTVADGGARADSVGGWPPSFTDYPVTETLTDPPAEVDLSSHPRASEFRTALRQGAAKGANFAGVYRVVGWGCGTNCQTWAIVDLRSGKIVGWRGTAFGAEFRLESRILILESDAVGDPLAERHGATPHYLIIQDGVLHELSPGADRKKPSGSGDDTSERLVTPWDQPVTTAIGRQL